MTAYLGTGISRQMEADDKGLAGVIWQEGMPPLDSELNLMSLIELEARAKEVKSRVASGWLFDELNPQKYFKTSPNYSGFFYFGQENAPVHAVVNGWVIPVAYTNNDSYLNKIRLDAPGTGSSSTPVDFVYLEAWLAEVKTGKNLQNGNVYYKYGNVLSDTGGILSDLVDTDIGFETTKRIQIQYAIRTKRLSSPTDVSNVATIFGSITARGPNTQDTSKNFIKNLADSGDPGCFRAGDTPTSGNEPVTKTVDGYIYAIPLCAIFRRADGTIASTTPWNAQNRSKYITIENRTVETLRSLTFPVLTIDAPDFIVPTSYLQDTVLDVRFSDGWSADPLFFKVDDEIIAVRNITDLGGNKVVTIERAQKGTLAAAHTADAVAIPYTDRPDGLFADQIAKTDILDLRHSIADKFNYDGILKANLVALLRDNLHTDHKNESNLKGTYLSKRDTIGGNNATFTPDGVRTIWSDAAVTQRITIPINIPAVGAAANSNLVYISPTPVYATPVTLKVSGSARPAAGFVAGDIIKIVPPSGSVFVEQKSIFQGKMSYPVVIRIDGLSGSDVSWDSEKPNHTGTNTESTPDTSKNVFTHGNGFNLNIVDGAAELTIPTGSPLIGLPISEKTVWIECVVQYKPGYGISQKPAFIHQASVVENSGGLTVARRPGGIHPVTPISESGLMQHGVERSFAVNSEFMFDLGSKTIFAAPYKSVELRPLMVRSAEHLNVFKDNGNWDQQGLMPSKSLDGASVLPTPVEINSSYLFWDNVQNSESGKFVDIPLDFLPKLGLQHVPSVIADSGKYRKGINFIFTTLVSPTTASPDRNSGIVAYRNDSFTYQVTSFNEFPNKPYGKIDNRIIYGKRVTHQEIVDSDGKPYEGIALPAYLGFAHIDGVYTISDSGTVGTTNLLRFGWNGPTVLLKADQNGDVVFSLNRRATNITDAEWSIPTNKWVISCQIFGFDIGFLQTNGRVAILASGPNVGNFTSTNIGMIVNAPIAANNVTANIDYTYSAYQGAGGRSQKSNPTVISGSQSTTDVLKTKNSALDAPSELTLSGHKPFEVLSAINFTTSLGTGRLSGGSPIPALTGGPLTSQNPNELPEVAGSQLFLSRVHSVARVGSDDYSDINDSGTPLKWPVLVTSNSDTLGILADQLSEVYDNEVPSEWLGATCQLPLGSYLRDKDFTGKTLYQTRSSINFASIPVGTLSFSPYEASQVNGLRTRSGWEGLDSQISKSMSVSGAGNEMLVMVDALDANVNSSTKNFRTYRGGAGFSVNDPFSGGTISSRFPKARPNSESSLTLNGTAYLVKGAQNIGGTHYGNELQMVVVTQASYAYMKDSDLAHSANGLNMGFTAMDVYRVMGRPLEKHGFQITNIDLTGLKPGPRPKFQNKVYDDPIFYGSSDAPMVATYQQRMDATSDEQVEFTPLSARPTVPNTVQMFHNGVKLVYGLDYEVEGTTNQTVRYLNTAIPMRIGDIVEFWYLAY